MEFNIVLFAVMEMLFIVISEGSCPSEQWRRLHHRSVTCIKYFAEPLSYTDAIENCRITGSDLVAITKINQIKAISSVLNMTYMRIWSGIRLTKESNSDYIQTHLRDILMKNISTFEFENISDIWNAFNLSPSNDICLDSVTNNQHSINFAFRNCNELLPFVCEYRKKQNLIFDNVPGLPEPVIKVLDYVAIGVGVMIGVVLIMVLVIDFIRKVKQLKTVHVGKEYDNMDNSMDIEMKS